MELKAQEPTDGFYLQPLRLVCARLLTYFEELRAPLAQGEPPTHTPLTHDLARDQMGGSGPVEIGVEEENENEGWGGGLQA